MFDGPASLAVVYVTVLMIKEVGASSIKLARNYYYSPLYFILRRLVRQVWLHAQDVLRSPVPPIIGYCHLWCWWWWRPNGRRDSRIAMLSRHYGRPKCVFAYRRRWVIARLTFVVAYHTYGGLRLREEVVDCFDDIRKVRTIYMLGGS